MSASNKNSTSASGTICILNSGLGCCARSSRRIWRTRRITSMSRNGIEADGEKVNVVTYSTSQDYHSSLLKNGTAGHPRANRAKLSVGLVPQDQIGIRADADRALVGQAQQPRYVARAHRP